MTSLLYPVPAGLARLEPNNLGLRAAITPRASYAPPDTMKRFNVSNLQDKVSCGLSLTPPLPFLANSITNAARYRTADIRVKWIRNLIRWCEKSL
jgi:hypothetical protein